MLAPTFIKNPEYVNTSTSQNVQNGEEQPWSENTGLGTQMAFMIDYPQKASMLQDRETPRGNEDVPLMGTLIVLAIKRATRFSNASPSSCAKSSRGICSSTDKPGSFCVWQHNNGWKLATWITPQQRPLLMIAPVSSLNPPQILGTSNWDIPNDMLSGEDARPKDSTCFGCYVPDAKNGRLSQMSPTHSAMLSHTGNLLFIIRLHNPMEKYGTPFLEQIGYPMISILERATIMPQVSTSVGITSQYPSQVLSLLLMADNNLTVPAANLFGCLKQRG